MRDYGFARVFYFIKFFIMVVFKAYDERTHQSLDVYFDDRQELNIEVRNSINCIESIVLDNEQTEELLLFLQKKIK